MSAAGALAELERERIATALRLHAEITALRGDVSMILDHLTGGAPVRPKPQPPQFQRVADAIMAYLADGEWRTMQSIHRAVRPGGRKSSVSGRLSELLDAGKIERRGYRGAHEYRVVLS